LLTSPRSSVSDQWLKFSNCNVKIERQPYTNASKHGPTHGGMEAEFEVPVSSSYTQP
jgi:hypothetical protein